MLRTFAFFKPPNQPQLTPGHNLIVSKHDVDTKIQVDTGAAGDRIGGVRHKLVVSNHDVDTKVQVDTGAAGHRVSGVTAARGTARGGRGRGARDAQPGTAIPAAPVELRAPSAVSPGVQGGFFLRVIP